MAPKRIVILRHGEKPGNPADPDTPANPDLSPPGFARATRLVTIIPGKFGGPDFLVAAADSVKSHRPVETLQPLANELHFESDRFIQTYVNADYSDLATDLLTKSDFSGKLVIVCWHHGNIPDLALALRAPLAQLMATPEMSAGRWDPTVFDRFWILDYGAGDAVAFQSMAQA